MPEFTTSIEAEDRLRKIIAELPAHHRAELLVRIDRGSIYQHVLAGWDDYFDRAEALPASAHRMIHKLIASGLPSTSGTASIICRHPGKGPEIQDWLNVGERAGKSLGAWLRSCPLIKPHPDLPGHIIVYGRVEDLRQGDAHPQLPLVHPDVSGGPHPADATGTIPLSCAQAPDDGFLLGAKAHDEFGSSGALAPDPSTPPGASAHGHRSRLCAEAPGCSESSGAQAPDLPELHPKSGAQAPGDLGRYVGRYVNTPTYLTTSPPAHSSHADSGPAWLPEPDMAEPDPTIVDALEARFIGGRWLDVFSRCSVVTEAMIASASETAKTPGIFGYRLAQRIKGERARQRRAERRNQPKCGNFITAEDPAREAELEEQLAEARRIMQTTGGVA